MATRRAPWDGGLDQVIRTIFSIWDRTRFKLSWSLATTVRFPTLSSVESGYSLKSNGSGIKMSSVERNVQPVGTTYCTDRSSLRTTGHRIIQNPVTQSSGWPRHLCLNFLRQIPDRLNQRRQTDSFAEESGERRKKVGNYSSIDNITFQVQCPGWL